MQFYLNVTFRFYQNMDIDNIQKKAREMKSREDLLELLNILKQDDMTSRGMADLYHPFEMRQILRYCNPNLQCRRYTQFQIPKKKAGEFRTISAPVNHTYKTILHYVDMLFRIMYEPSAYAMGFVNGRSVVTNASIHKGQHYVFNLDLKDFFPSIEQARVWKRLQMPPFNFTQPVANVIAGLCSMRETREMEKGEKKDLFILPQGAPTSPSITNMICDKLDRRLAGVAKRYNLKYTRYADDITFSSMHNVYQENSEVRKEIKRIIEDQGFRINDKKTRLQKHGSCQEVTGLILSDKVNVTQKYVRNIRNLLYIWDRYGYDIASRRFLPRYRKDKGHVKKGIPDMVNVLEGKLLYLKMVKGEEDSVYLRLRTKFLLLCDKYEIPKPVAIDIDELNNELDSLLNIQDG